MSLSANFGGDLKRPLNPESLQTHPDQDNTAILQNPHYCALSPLVPRDPLLPRATAVCVIKQEGTLVAHR